MRAVLMFHGVDPSGSVLSVTAGELRSLVLSIRESGHRIVPLSELLAARRERAVALTFDDGFASLAENAGPVLRELQAPATLFLTTSYVGRDNRWPTQPPDAPLFAMMSWGEIETLKAQGWSIEAHSCTHPDMRALSDDALDEELQAPIATIEQRLGTRSEILAYPYGYYDGRVVERARRHYRAALTTVFRPLASSDHPHRLPRLDAYYLRSPGIHRRFGSGPLFQGYLALRALLRRARRHPGEIRA